MIPCVEKDPEENKKQMESSIQSIKEIINKRFLLSYRILLKDHDRKQMSKLSEALECERSARKPEKRKNLTEYSHIVKSSHPKSPNKKISK